MYSRSESAAEKCRLQMAKKRIGFTNRLAIYLLLFLAAGLAGGFVLAFLSIKYQYTGALMCWTVVFTPIGTAISLVIGAVVNKSKAENTSGNGDGIVYAKAMASGFVEETYEKTLEDIQSPAI